MEVLCKRKTQEAVVDVIDTGVWGHSAPRATCVTDASQPVRHEGLSDRLIEESRKVDHTLGEVRGVCVSV